MENIEKIDVDITDRNIDVNYIKTQPNDVQDSKMEIHADQILESDPFHTLFTPNKLHVKQKKENHTM